MNLSDLAAQAEGKILSGVVANVGHVVINNPERHNAISLDMYQAAAERVNEMAEDRQARLLVIQGAGGKAFASGADISKFENERSSGDQVEVEGSWDDWRKRTFLREEGNKFTVVKLLVPGQKKFDLQNEVFSDVRSYELI